MNTYTVHLFEENDNIRLIYDRYNLVSHLIQLYKQIDVNIKSTALGYNVNTYEKELITSILADTRLSTVNSHDTYDKINDIIEGVIRLYDLKHELSISARSSKILEPMGRWVDKSLELNVHHQHTSTLQDIRKEKKATPLQVPLFEISMYQRSDPSKPIQFDSVFTTGTKVEPSCLDSEFTSVMDEVKREINQNHEYSDIGIIYNTIYECVIVCDITSDLRQIVKEFPDFKLIRDYKDLSASSANMIRTYFLNNMYCDIDTVTKKIDAFESLYDLTKNPLEEEKTLILYYIKSYYNISSTVEKRIKVSVLLEEVEKELKLKSSNNLKYRFASILAELGLQKKRYSDGMYIYGIESKAMAKVRGDLEKKLSEQDIDTYLAKRDEELKRPLLCQSKKI